MTPERTPERTRELLENCAKACGYEVLADGEENGLYVQFSDMEGHRGYWHPLESSADEAEMEDTLRLDVSWGERGVAVADCYENFADHPTTQLARMMAGCRAAEAVYLERGK